MSTPQLPDSKASSPSDSVADQRAKKPVGDPRIAGLDYPSLYVLDFDGTLDFFTQVIGPPAYREATLAGFPLGDSWLTIFTAKIGMHPDSDPRNCEFAIRVKEPPQVDELHAAFVAAGSTTEMEPVDTWMYRKMRFSCVNTPVGARIDLFCPLPDDAEVADMPPGM